jgi:pimeloyl-ACP methyl ester carboxylesterase
MIAILALGIAVAAARPLAVMVHGAGGGGWEYRLWKPVFENAGYRVVSADLEPAASGLAATTVEDYVKQIAAWSGDGPAVLIGASMGGVLALLAAERVHPKALVLVCSATPAGVGSPMAAKNYPDVIRWANGPYADTVASMPDSDEATRRFAHPRWRDESGRVLREISAGVSAAKPLCPTLSVIPEADDTVAPDRQQALATWANADTLRYAGMSHVGPLLSRRATAVAKQVVRWLLSGNSEQ